MTEEYKSIKEKFSKLKQELREKLYQLSQDESEELLEVINFKGKYLHINEPQNTYLFVNEQFGHKDIYTDEPVLILRGQGFSYAFTQYEDCTYSSWDQFFGHTIKIDNLDEALTHIEEITKEEYDKAFDSMIVKMIDEHKVYFKG
jgi:hypothetical protein